MSSSDSTSRRTRANGRRTRRRLIDKAERLFAAQGYEATSLRQIAAAADVDASTVKYHFDDKSALFAVVYRRGHEAFLEHLSPMLDELDAVGSRAELRAVWDDFVVSMHDFIEENLAFVRLTLFRMLEESADVILVEEELQTVAIAQLEERFRRLVDRGIIEPIDPRGVVVFLVSSFTMWHVTARTKKSWLGSPSIDTEAGRARSESFFIDSIERMLGIADDD
jgi:AcrR family transcriptional regulator